MAESIGAMNFFETSAKTGTGMKELDFHLRKLCLSREKGEPVVPWGEDPRPGVVDFVRPFAAPEPDDVGEDHTDAIEVMPPSVVEEDNLYVEREPEPPQPTSGDAVPRPATGDTEKKTYTPHDSDDGCCIVM